MSKHTSSPDAKFLEQKAQGLAAAHVRSKPRSDLPRRGRHGHHNACRDCGASFGRCKARGPHACARFTGEKASVQNV